MRARPGTSRRSRARHRLAQACLALAMLTPGADAAAQAPAAPALAARRAHDTLTSSYSVGGIRVIHRRNTANEVVAANVYLLGGVRQTTDASAGIEASVISTVRKTLFARSATLRNALPM